MNKTLYSVTAVAAAATRLSATITHVDPLSYTLEDGDTWYLDGNSSGSLAYFWTSAYSSSTYFGPYGPGPGSGSGSTYKWASVYRAGNNFQLAKSVSNDVRNLSSGANVTNGIFSGTYTWAGATDFSGGSMGYNWNQFSRDNAAYAGFQFDQGSGTQYGWVSLTWNEDMTLTLNEWAYADVGESIAVGAVPEPADFALGLGALAMGAAGMRRYKKARSEKK